MKNLLIGLIAGLLIGGGIIHAATPPQPTDAAFRDSIEQLFINWGWTPPTTTPNPPSNPPSVSKPSDLVGRKWTVMAPFNKVGSTSSPENLYIAKAELDSRYNPHMFLRNGALVFSTPVNGAHSANSDYPRTELREMKDENWGEAKWSNKTGTHTLTAREAITATPVVKPHVIAAQIHDGSDDVIQVRLEGKELAVHYNDSKNRVVLEPNYILGTQYDLKIVASGSRIKVTYNGVQKADISKSGSSWYFKIGSYVNSNPSKGDAPDALGEVEVYSLNVTHE